ncbi:MAG TPA: alpha/beta hydrolase [Rugosimonospora sp.]|nr:alpha/beta hydrolase [Rugosimonospora sp.]
MSYAIDPELVPWLAMLPMMTVADPVAARTQSRELLAALPPADLSGLTVDNRTIPGPPGAPDVPVRVYRPTGVDRPLPAVLEIHGGGFLLGDLDFEEQAAASVAREVTAVVVSVDYRLAPEHPYPAAVEDCYAALTWLVASAGELGVDPERVAVYGESAGGGLCAAVALLARDRGGPRVTFQFLGIPELDDRLDTPSMQSYVDTPLWHRPNAELSWAFYLGDAAKPGGPEVSPYAAPARAENLTGLPPAYITVCQFDPLRDEGIDYAKRLAQAGVPVELHLYPATFHGSALIAGAAVSQRMHQDAIAALQRAL